MEVISKKTVPEDGSIWSLPPWAGERCSTRAKSQVKCCPLQEDFPEFPPLLHPYSPHCLGDTLPCTWVAWDTLGLYEAPSSPRDGPVSLGFGVRQSWM